MRISTDKSNVPIERIVELLKDTYWAENRSGEVIKTSIESSECIFAWDEDLLIGFMRIVTDYVTMFWLCDVVVDEAYRGRGIGKAMMDHLSKQPYYSPLKGILATKDAHGLYEAYGFIREPEKMMMKPRSD